MIRRVALAATAALLFGIAATANSGGYRYGISDQAFYATAVVKDLQPALFPRDTPLLDVQSKLMLADEIVAGIVRLTGVDLPGVLFGLYVLTMIALGGAAIAFARASGYSWTACGLLLVLLTFRHRIAKTGANSLEGYMHPRMLAFACGVFAFAGVVRGRRSWIFAGLAIAACWHPTTALWFGMASAAAFLPSNASRWTPAARRHVAIAAAACVLAGAWLIARGPLGNRLVVMDSAWLAVLAEKDYLFPHQWPAYAWIVNLAYPFLIVAIFRRRRRLGVATAGESALVRGLLALVLVFVVTFPFTIFRVALAVQSQVTRVFWVLDFVTAAYVAWWLADGVRQWPARVRTLMVAVVAAASIARGVFLLGGDRALVRVDLPDTAWIGVMRWLRTQPSSWYVLADPGHAWKYGVSVRLAGERDTLLESGKDTALAMYDRGLAMTIADRLAALRDFETMSSADVRALAARYGLDVAVVETSRRLDLPELYRNSAFVVYRLR